MNFRNIIFLLLFGTFGCRPVESPKKLVFIILDGIPADVLESVNTPSIDEISKLGTYTRASTGGEVGGDSETPTISAVGYNSLITGTWANKHNVYGNGIKSPNYEYWNIFRIVESSDSTIKTAIFSTWLDNRTKLLGEGLNDAGGVKLDYSFDGFELDTLRFPHLPDRKYIFDIDELVSKEASSYILEEAPTLSWVYLEYTDDMGHLYGDSPQFHLAIQQADIQVGRIWDSIKKREEESGEEWMIFITTDHGRKMEDGKGHGGQSDRERTIWFVTNQRLKTDTAQPELVDGLPTMLEFLEIEAPESIRVNFDGKSILNNKN